MKKSPFDIHTKPYHYKHNTENSDTDTNTLITADNANLEQDVQTHAKGLKQQHTAVLAHSSTTETNTDDTALVSTDPYDKNHVEVFKSVFHDHASKVETLVNYLSETEVGISKLDVYKNPPVTDVQIYKDIVNKIPEINDKIRLFCRGTSQTNRRLVTPIMMNTTNSPYRILKQILAQIEDTKSKIIGYINEESKINAETKHKLCTSLVPSFNADSEEQIDTVISQYSRRQLQLFRNYPYLEAALRELYSLIEAYYEIKKNKNIPDDWDEIQVELDEIKGNIGLGFRNGIKDYMQTMRVSGSTMELLEGYGISPFEVFSEIATFFNQNVSTPYTYDEYSDFIESMCEKYKDNYKKALSRIGLDSCFLEKAASKCTLPKE